jgi:DNA polymerase I-like protein with 3'-5' exonuclease and polymerase domains
VHFAARANLSGAKDAVAQFQKNPRTDYHKMVADMANIPRSTAKTLNLGLAYGMGGAKLARSLKLPTQWMKIVKEGRRTSWVEIREEDVAELRAQHNDCIEVAGNEAKAIIKKWEEGAPFMRGLYKMTSGVAEERGFIKTLLGRRCRFQLGKDGRYVFTHKAMNRLCQGSAADQTKQGMLDLWREGVVPLLSIHDELVFSVKDKDEAQKYAPIMENAIPLLVPSIVDVNLGRTWGEVEK